MASRLIQKWPGYDQTGEETLSQPLRTPLAELSYSWKALGINGAGGEMELNYWIIPETISGLSFVSESLGKKKRTHHNVCQIAFGGKNTSNYTRLVSVCPCLTSTSTKMHSIHQSGGQIQRKNAL